MNAPLRLPPFTWTRNAQILLAHTALFATLGTLVTGKHSQVRKLRIMRKESTEYRFTFSFPSAFFSFFYFFFFLFLFLPLFFFVFVFVFIFVVVFVFVLVFVSVSGFLFVLLFVFVVSFLFFFIFYFFDECTSSTPVCGFQFSCTNTLCSFACECKAKKRASRRSCQGEKLMHCVLISMRADLNPFEKRWQHSYTHDISEISLQDKAKHKISKFS